MTRRVLRNETITTSFFGSLPTLVFFRRHADTNEPLMDEPYVEVFETPALARERLAELEKLDHLLVVGATDALTYGEEPAAVIDPDDYNPSDDRDAHRNMVAHRIAVVKAGGDF